VPSRSRFKCVCQLAVSHFGHCIFLAYGAVQRKSVDFSFIVADDTDLLLKGVIALNIAADYTLHPAQRGINIGNSGELARFQQHHLDCLGGLLCLTGSKGIFLKPKLSQK
jgi:hypothetical protein